MTIASNAYAEKVFAEHPIALWSLDDNADYVSLITETQREISTGNGWTIAGATAAIYGLVPGEENPLPRFDTSVINKLTLGSSPSSPAIINLEGPVALADETEIDPAIDNITIGSFFYPFSEIVDVSIGIEYTDTSSGTPITGQRQVQGYRIDNAEQWAFISGTFDLPNSFEDLKPVIDISILNAATADKVLVHGLSLAQKSEQFNVQSLGVIPQTLPNTIALTGQGVPAAIYGLQDSSGYYLANKNIMTAKNSGLPMVYGTDTSTVITPNTVFVEDTIVNHPSLILPGYGFLNAYGQSSTLTWEMWLKIQSSATTPKRIMGPIGSQDGLYVNDSFLILKVGPYKDSYYVGEWDRPMLVAIRISADKAELVINGEEVLELSIKQDQIDWPTRYNEDGKDQDYIGFYAYDDVPVIEIDCVGLYPYLVPNIVEKRRWIYGQGVQVTETLTGSSLGTTVYFDYTFANYAKNYLYPDIGKWNQGVPENIVVEPTTLSLPQYELPELVFTNKNEEDWIEDNAGLTALFGNYISLRPNSTWNETQGYLYFPRFNLLQQDLKGFYCLLESDGTTEEKQTLFVIENPVTGEYLEATIEDNVTTYSLTYKSIENGQVVEKTEVAYTDNFHNPGDFLFVGLDLDKFSRYAGGRISQFLGSKKQLRMYVGGRPDLTQTFVGNIYRIGFCTARNLEKISNVFSSTGLPVGYNAIDSLNVADAGGSIFTNDNPANGIYNWDRYFDGGDQYFGNSSTIYEEIIDGGGVYSLLVSYILAHVASYTLTPKVFLGEFMLDVGVNSYWQDYVPLSYFAKFVTDGTTTDEGVANKYLDVDFIQINVDYPAINKFLANSYDTTNSIVRTYISFQELSDDPNIGVSKYYKIVLPPKNGVVNPIAGEWQVKENGNTAYAKYEVVNDTIVYPPQDINFNKLGIVLHIEIISNGIVENPVKIRSFQMSSQALNAFVSNPVGTRFGTSVFPYRKSSELYDYKGRNPFSISKKSNPYFYLTSNSGMRLRGFYPGDVERGIEMPINPSATEFYKASAWQFALRYDDDTFPEQVTEIFEIYAKSAIKENLGEDYIQHIKFYMKPDGGSFKRGRIYAIDAKTGQEQDGITYYINGRVVHSPVIDSRTWTMLGFTLAEPIDFSGYRGYASVTGPIMFNSVSHYQISEADEASRSVYRKWFAVKTVDGTDEDWDYWKTLDADSETAGVQTFTWQKVLFISSNDFIGINGSIIYKKYVGTNRIVVDTESEFSIQGYEYLGYKNISWQTTIITPA
jgi:hypothetical protein